MKGTDPATDFRGMGIVALNHMIYFAKNYNKTFTGIMEHHQDNDPNYYPVATAGINISKMLCDVFRDSEDGIFRELREG